MTSTLGEVAGIPIYCQAINVDKGGNGEIVQDDEHFADIMNGSSLNGTEHVGVLS